MGVLALAAAGSAEAGPLRVEVEGVRSAAGSVLVALCSEEAFLRAGCERASSAPARPGVTAVWLQDVPAGVFAIQAVHDENGNRRLDRTVLGLPREGMGFSRDGPMRSGPPRFAEAAVSLGPDGGATRLRVRYFRPR